MPGFGEGVFQRGAGVAQGRPAKLLGLVDMAQGHIVKGVKKGGVDVVQAAHRPLLRIRKLRPGDKLVAEEHIPLAPVDGRSRKHRRHRVLIAHNVPVRVKAPHRQGPDEGQEAHHHLAVGVKQGILLQNAGKALADIDP